MLRIYRLKDLLGPFSRKPRFASSRLKYSSRSAKIVSNVGQKNAIFGILAEREELIVTENLSSGRVHFVSKKRLTQMNILKVFLEKKCLLAGFNCGLLLHLSLLSNKTVQILRVKDAGDIHTFDVKNDRLFVAGSNGTIFSYKFSHVKLELRSATEAHPHGICFLSVLATQDPNDQREQNLQNGDLVCVGQFGKIFRVSVPNFTS